MIRPEALFRQIRSKGITFFTGVPDSLLKDLCFCIEDNVSGNDHVIAANEGAAVALAAGHYLATGKPAMVYMQNSGLGNSVNPLLSMADEEVYSIPVLIVAGWRGEPGRKDEPQHKKQGRVMLKMIEAMEYDAVILEEDEEGMKEQLRSLFDSIAEKKRPHFLIVKEGTFEKYVPKKKLPDTYQMSREEAIEIILSSADQNDIVVSTTGKASREVFEYRKRTAGGHNRDFLTVGSMGHCGQIALGIALSKPERRVIALDGDGAVIMHMGSLAITGASKAENIMHVVLNNESHESVGGQPTSASLVDFPRIASACGYVNSLTASNRDELQGALAILSERTGPSFLEVKVNKLSRADLGRPDRSPLENRKDFMKFVSGETD